MARDGEGWRGMARDGRDATMRRLGSGDGSLDGKEMSGTVVNQERAVLSSVGGDGRREGRGEAVSCWKVK
jgi:hypothetical protein